MSVDPLLQGPAAPIAAAEFSAAMARLGPFETTPALAVAVSGGGDSLALALLARDWAREQGGSVTALIVDHRLRAESTAEAAQAAGLLQAAGIPSIILSRETALAPGNLQGEARALRYRLLRGWCEREGVLHLLTAHHREDQAETLLLRLARGSGLNGLAAMPPIVETGECRLLRPLLGFARARLRAVVAAAGIEAIDDPSNRNSAFARVRVRQADTALAALGLDAGRLATTAGHLGRARQALEAATDCLLAEAATLHPGGYGTLSLASLRHLPEEIRLRALAQLLACIGGGEYPPRFERLERLCRALTADNAGFTRTLAGCVVTARRGLALIYREAKAVAPPLLLSPGESGIWDGRFHISVWDGAAVAVEALGAEDASRLRKGIAAQDTAIFRSDVPPNVVWPVLPALRSAATIQGLAWDLWVPHPGIGPSQELSRVKIEFIPARALTETGFTVV